MVIMKFKAGNEVEVCGREEHLGAWFPATIVRAGSQAYTVSYEWLLTDEGVHVVEKVQEEDVRRRPPLVQPNEKWVLGDIVEVFDTHSWRAGKIVKALGHSHFVVKIFGSIQLKEFHASKLRIRQIWQNDQWVVIGKVNEKKQFDSNYTHSRSKYTAHLVNGANIPMGREGYITERTEEGYDRTISPVQTLKNLSLNRNSFIHDVVKRSGKKRKINQQMVESHQQTKRPRARTPPPLALQTIEENNECSVASCSGNNLLAYTTQDKGKYSKEAVGSLFDETGSSCPIETEEKRRNGTGGKKVANVHDLELHAYKSTMEALYAYGPLSWEHESLLTNLRLSLHISNEEHLLQLKSLLSA